jgi:hypothetical protein
VDRARSHSSSAVKITYYCRVVAPLDCVTRSTMYSFRSSGEWLLFGASQPVRYYTHHQTIIKKEAMRWRLATKCQFKQACVCIYRGTRHTNIFKLINFIYNIPMVATKSIVEQDRQCRHKNKPEAIRCEGVLTTTSGRKPCYHKRREYHE